LGTTLSCAPQLPPEEAEEAAAPATPPPPKAGAPGQLAPFEPLTALPAEADDIIVGPPNAEVTVVFFFDLQCPFCSEGFATLEHLRSSPEGKEVRFVLKHLPLPMHQEAIPAAVATQAVRMAKDSEAALTFVRESFQSGDLSFQALEARALLAGVTREAYRELVTREDTTAQVAQDVRVARRAGVRGTPAFFVNGRAYPGAQPEDVLRAALREERLALAALPPGAPAERYGARVQSNFQASRAEALFAESPLLHDVPVDGSPTLGPPTARVTVVVFSDYECPYCKRLDESLRELSRRHPQDLRLVWKHHPLPFHASARPAAQLVSTLCARNPARCNEGHFAVFDAAPDLSVEHLGELGQKLGLTEVEVTSALGNGTADSKDRLARDELLAEDLEVDGTPALFWNGRKVTGARPLDELEALFAETLRAAQVKLSGKALEEPYPLLIEDGVRPGAPVPLEKVLTVASEPTRGPANAEVTIHIWSDYQCPFCRRAEATLRELSARYPKEVRFVWHDLPLPFHDRALPAALAAREALRQQGPTGFWQFHDAIFNPTGSTALVDEDDLLHLGREQGLREAELRKALQAESHPALTADGELAETLGIRGTPAFVVGRYLISGARPLPHFIRAVELTLAEQKKGTPTPPAP